MLPARSPAAGKTAPPANEPSPEAWPVASHHEAIAHDGSFQVLKISVFPVIVRRAAQGIHRACAVN